MSKGSNRRPEDVEAFDSGYNNIFKGGVKRGRFIFDEEKKEFVPASEYTPSNVAAPFVLADIQPYKSMQTGEMIGGRRQHREHLRQHRLIEIGNEVKAHLAPKAKPDTGLRRDIIEAYKRHN